jgi:PEP-CTERM motif
VCTVVEINMNLFRMKAIAAVLALTAATAAQSATLFTTDRATFTAAHSGLTVEGFENAAIGSGSHAAFTGPLNAATNNSSFAPGSVASGFSLFAGESRSVYVSRDVGGNSGANVSSDLFEENMTISFAPGVTALGIDLLQWFGNDGGWALEVYDVTSRLLGSFSTAAGGFVGITSTSEIDRLFLDKPNSGAVIDNLRFGAAHSVPEPGSLLLAALALVGLRLSQRRKSQG